MACRFIGNKGNDAIKKLAPAIKTSTTENLILNFIFCNLNENSQHLLADAIAENAYISGFKCLLNDKDIHLDYFKRAAMKCISPYLIVFQTDVLYEQIHLLRKLYHFLAVIVE